MSRCPRQPSSSASAARRATSSCRAASRPRPRSRSARARSASSSQASAASRPPSSAAARSCGTSIRRPRGARRRQLARDVPLAVGDGLAGAVADPRDERARRVGIGGPGVGGGDPPGGDRAGEDAQRLGQQRLAPVAERPREPRLGGLLGVERLRVDDGRPGHLDRRRGLAGLGAARPPARAGGEARAARRLAAADDQHVADVVAGEAPDDVAPRLRAEAPRELPLDEPEAAPGIRPGRRAQSPGCAPPRPLTGVA